MLLRVAAERAAPPPSLPDLAPAGPPPRPAPATRATFPPDGLTPATPEQIRAFFSK